MSTPAFYLPPAQWENPLLLQGGELDHAHVLRLKPGDDVTLLDGCGRRALCRIESINKKSALLHIVTDSVSPPPKARPVMALALSKAVRRDFFMEKAAELGAWEIWLWQARYSQGRLNAALARSIEGKLIAGIKQSQNPWLPKVRTFDGIEGAIEAAKSIPWRVLPWENQSGIPMATTSDLGRAGETIYMIGPEGGFAEEELVLLSAAEFLAVSFGNRILRCETAATLCLGLHWWASQLPGHPDFREANA